MLNNRLLTYLLIAVFVLSTLFTSCKKNDDDKVQLVRTMTIQDAEFPVTFEYDKKNRITNITTFAKLIDNTGQVLLTGRFTWQFIYNGNDLIKLIYPAPSSGSDEEFFCSFSKNDNKITVHNRDGAFRGEIELNKDGFPITASQSYIREDSIARHIQNSWTYQYLDGNLASITFMSFINGTQVSNQIKTFKYENTKPPFYYCKIPQWTIYLDEIIPTMGMQSMLYRNNISEYKSWGYLYPEFEIDKKIDYTYEYDNNGFPTKMYIDGKLWATYTYY